MAFAVEFLEYAWEFHIMAGCLRSLAYSGNVEKFLALGLRWLPALLHCFFT
jgi:hypothetical protein